MSERPDINFERLTKVLDTVNEALVDVNKKRDEQTKSISDVSVRLESKTNIITEKCNKLEGKIRKVENDIIESNSKNTIQTKNIHSNFERRITSIEENIKQIEKSLEALRIQYEENNKVLEELRPKVGKKRKWWQVI